VLVSNQHPTEAKMNTTETNTIMTTKAGATGRIAMKLEVVIVPVSDAERAKQFYASIGWREDADFIFSEDFRVLQFTPPGSDASIIFGTGVTNAIPGSGGNLLLAVSDIEAARTELIEHGVDVSAVFHGVAFDATGQRREPGPDPERKSYSSYASFSDPDGNEYLLQEVTSRLPGRVEDPDVAKLGDLLLETALGHHHVETTAAPHDWWDWYAPYLSARERGSTRDEATAAADSYLEEARGVVVPR
jgi:catechol 2,3-dioxygenase-like lactoylglutathione lyase family enzyme